MFNDQEKANRYVIYVRKSTDEKGKQEKSIPDQIYYCKQLAKNYGLNIADIIEEKKSAKTSNERPKFNKMLDDIYAQKYDGIIAWHPDRLSRNMGDGGKIIEMVDEEIIKDLRFYTQQFSRDANGKMLLGLSFVLSKQYSDKLSDDVNRGNIRGHEAGKAIGRVKHGYDIDENGRYVKGEFWDTLQKAWKKRLSGESEVSICEWLNKEGYYRQIKNPNKQRAKQLISPQKLNRIFKDSFYYGLTSLHGREVYLPDKYNFPTMITEEEYLAVQRNPSKRGKYTKIPLPLRGKIFDANIEGIEYKPQMIRNKAKDIYLMYVVDNSHKKRLTEEQRKTIKAVRTKKIVRALDLIFQKLNPKFTEKDYKKYISIAKDYVQEQRQEREEERRRISRMRGKAQSERDSLVQNFLEIGSKYNATELKGYKEKLQKLENEIKNYSEELAISEKQESNLIPSFEEFLNTIKTLSASYHSFSGQKRLEIAELLVLNILVSNGEVQKIELQPPFDELFPEKILNGWG